MSKTLFLVGYGVGVGHAVAKRFARDGYAIGAIARKADTLAGIEALAHQFSVKTAVATADAGNEVGLRAAISALTGTLGAPDTLVYNAAAVTEAMPSALSFEQLLRDFAVSVGGALVATQSVLPAMREAGAGSLLFTSGGFAFQPYAGLASLGVGKAGLRNLVQSLHQELASSGIKVGAITIGGTVGSGPAFMPDVIAEHFWAFHTGDGAEWERMIR